ncbi:MAG TPA: creatininase family protein [Balneolales bacterium]|nr:creatininase family protein [Balneolales bacterium]
MKDSDKDTQNTTGRPYILAETTWDVVKKTDYDVAILPWGATEAHNYHLPYATDNYQSDYVAMESARKAWEKGAKVVVLPCVPFGVNTGQFDIKLDINMNPSTQAAVLKDVAASVYRAGIKKFLVMNGHGGNNFKQIIREVGVEFSGMVIFGTNWWQVADGNQYFDEPGDHAGELETSAMQFIVPEFVKPLETAGDGSSNPFTIKALRDGKVWTQRLWSKATNDTGVGNPKMATPEKGKRFIDKASDDLAEFLVDLSQTDLNDLYKK